MSFSIAIAGTDETFDCRDGDILLRAGLRAGLGLPYECNVGACGTCKFELLAGEVETLRGDAPGLSERDRAKGRMLACQARPRSGCTVKLRLDDACRPASRPEAIPAVLREVSAVTHDIQEFCFVGPRPAVFLPGQYALLQLPGVDGARAYSMANLENASGEWRFQIRRVPQGAGTTALFEHMKPGDSIVIDGPYGLAYLRPEAQRDIVCIAGGSGLAPMLSIARGMAGNTAMSSARLHFFYGGKTPRDICGESMLRELPGFGERIVFHATVSAPEFGQTGLWHGHTGFVHELVEQTLDKTLAQYEFYLAGPPPMIEAAQKMLLGAHAVPAAQVHFDRYF